VNNFNLNPTTRYIERSNFKGAKALAIFIVILLSFIISAPLFIILYRYFPNITIELGTTFRLDLILSFLVVFIPVFTILRFFNKKIIIGFMGSFLIAMSILQVLNIYSFNRIKTSYLELINYVENNPVNIPFLREEKMTIRNADAIKDAIDYDNPELRNFAIKAATEYFNNDILYNKYGPVVRYFSIFKTINQWNYVPDPKGFDYFAKASESTKLLAGDCDDHAILMAACILAVGGESRLIHTKNHLYPEVKIGSLAELSMIYKLIKRNLFYKESLGRQIYYRVDSKDDVWLNFDYTGQYPGAKYLNQQIIGILNLP
jgi:hypothetical protein